MFAGKKSAQIREILISESAWEEMTCLFAPSLTLAAINASLKHLNENNGKLIDKPSLHTAIERYRNVVRESGLTGKYAPHSLRYAYSVDVMNYHMKKGFTKEEAQALASMDLGHGDGRGHYVARVYNKVE